ncbi:MAG: indole-3-glycerol phosphate synthase TrpC [Dehalococcoidia bacterium]|nr:indole-3-glycerol phosphate synthase TrpC [Dehalococcoidia bacterium]
MTDGARLTGTVLDRIVATRRERLAEDRRLIAEADLARRIDALDARPRDFAALLRHGRAATPSEARVRLIGEVKRASPSKGVFDADLDALAQARQYADAGVAAVSVLTEPDHFRGSIEDLVRMGEAFARGPDAPALLRKDFIFDPYQVLEARAAGADSLLLIVALLEPSALADLLALTRSYGMEPLVEVHDQPEVTTALAAGARVVGVNNRDLRTFGEDLGTTERLAPLLPPEVTLVAESAIRRPLDAARMVEAGAHALLVGEALVKSGDARAKALELMRAEPERLAHPVSGVGRGSRGERVE